MQNEILCELLKIMEFRDEYMCSKFLWIIERTESIEDVRILSAKIHILLKCVVLNCCFAIWSIEFYVRYDNQ